VTPITRSVANLNLAFSLLVAVMIAAAIRFLPLSASAFPLNDGGLFAHMATDLARNGFLLPTTTTYNGESIPFAYPPLGIYVTALISSVLGISSLDVLHWLPAAISTTSVLAVFVMSTELLHSRWRGLIAAAAFGFMPRSYEWLIVGGGITRALGLVLALLALQQGIKMLRTHRWRNVVATGRLGGLTVLSHPQAGVFLATSLATLWAFHFHRRRAVAAAVQLGAAGLIGLIVTGPWLLAVVVGQGLSPILSAGQTALDPWSGLSQLLGLSFGDTSVFDLVTALGLIGIIVRLARGQWMIPSWLILTMLIDPRAGMTFASVPLSLSAVPIVGELVQRMVPRQGSSATLESETLPRLVRSHRAAATMIILVIFVALRTAARINVDPASPLSGLAPDHIAAFQWARAETSQSATFAIVTGKAWEADYISEWFPVLTLRTSVATVQGSEWSGTFVDRLAMFRQLQACARETATCIEDWAKGWKTAPSYLFLAKGRLSGPRSPTDCCPALRQTLLSSDGYALVYDGPGATIFATVEKPGS
jgi:hypothetical protein